MNKRTALTTVLAVFILLVLATPPKSFAYTSYRYTYYISKDGVKHYTYYYYNRVVEPVKAPISSNNPIREYIISKFGMNASKALCIASKESGFNPSALHQNNDYYGSIDAGVFQINLHWHPYVSESEALNWKSNIDLAYQISNAGTNWSPWSTSYLCNTSSI